MASVNYERITTVVLKFSEEEAKLLATLFSNVESKGVNDHEDLFVKLFYELEPVIGFHDNHAVGLKLSPDSITFERVKEGSD